jgi:hypothetical protein
MHPCQVIKRNKKWLFFEQFETIDSKLGTVYLRKINAKNVKSLIITEAL